MDDLLSILGERLRNLRKEKGLSQEELAAIAEVHFSYIGKLERGEMNATIESLHNIMNALEVPMEDLFRFIQPNAGKDTHTLSIIMNRLQTRSIEDQKKALHLLDFVLNWKDEK
jgi:transcriptional regulator with XRE-family HTH domain